jgi:hypothetical protein
VAPPPRAPWQCRWFGWHHWHTVEAFTVPKLSGVVRTQRCGRPGCTAGRKVMP